MRVVIALIWVSAGAGTATFMILAMYVLDLVLSVLLLQEDPEYDADEPRRVAESIRTMGVKHAVITSVNRDELKTWC